MDIGIDDNQGLIYERDGGYGRALWPPPVVTPATLCFENEGRLAACRSLEDVEFMFREDAYDPIARIRRGRFYRRHHTQPARWLLHPHPATPMENNSVERHKKELRTFIGDSLWHSELEGKSEMPLVLLGVGDRFSIWTIVDIEGISTREDLVTLKSRDRLGVIPKLDYTKIPDESKSRIDESLNTFADDVARAAPSSVVDRAREAVTHVLLAYLDLSGPRDDLSQLAAALFERKKFLASNAAHVIAQLHTRGKALEQVRRKLIPTSEDDAELATVCVRTILREIGWVAA